MAATGSELGIWCESTFRDTMELWRELTVEPTGDKTHGPCDCCGQLTRRVWGYVHRTSGRTVASYFVSWMEKNSAHDDAVVDAIWLNDARIEEIRGWSPPRADA